MTVKAAVESPAVSQHAAAASAAGGTEPRFSCPPSEGVFLGAVTFYWHWAAYSGLLRRERIVIPRLTVACSVHSVTELAGITQILLKLRLRLFEEWDFEKTTLTVRTMPLAFITQKDYSQFYRHKVQ